MENTAWIDRDGNKYTMDQISDEYLLNILKFVSEGGGWTWFLCDRDKLAELFLEASRRDLKHNYSMVDADESLAKKSYKESLLWEFD